MYKKRRFTRIGRVILGIATEIIMTVFIMAFALGLSWLLSQRQLPLQRRGSSSKGTVPRVAAISDANSLSEKGKI